MSWVAVAWQICVKGIYASSAEIRKNCLLLVVVSAKFCQKQGMGVKLMGARVSHVPKSGSSDAQKLDMWNSLYNQELMCCFPLGKGLSWVEEMLPDFS